MVCCRARAAANIQRCPALAWRLSSRGDVSLPQRLVDLQPARLGKGYTGELFARDLFRKIIPAGHGKAFKRIAVGLGLIGRMTATTPGDAVATMRLAKGAKFPASGHSLAILLTDAETGAPVSLDYKRALSTRSDTRGNLQRVRLRLPVGTILPARVRAYVVADVFPMLARQL